jgi:hypothetical protein
LTNSPSAAYIYILWESNDTVSLVVEPAFTKLRASQPEVEFAGIESKGAAVSVHISRARSLESKPGLNIVGGVQPRGPRDTSVLDMSMLDVSMLDMPMLDVPMLDVPMLDVSMLDVPMLDVSMLDVSVICLFRCRIGCIVETGSADIVIAIMSVEDDPSAIPSIKVFDAADDDLDS